MVLATEEGQLSEECNLWRNSLRSFRNDFINYQAQLLRIAPVWHSRDMLLEIEHLHNQFHIQLINIHDLKHAIKKHKGKIDLEKRIRGHVSDDTLARHEFVYEEYQRLEATLQVVSTEFDCFLKGANR